MRTRLAATLSLALMFAVASGLTAVAAPVDRAPLEPHEPRLQDPGAGDDEDAQPDMSELILGTLADQPCQNVVTLPVGATVGLWWEYTLRGNVAYRWSIVAEREGALVIENPLEVGDVVVIQAYLVDPTVDTADVEGLEDGDVYPHNVNQAWVGLRGQAPVERPVMEPFPYSPPDGDMATPEVEEGEETITVDELEIPCRWSEYANARTWVAVSGPFQNLIVKSVYQGTVQMELTACGEDAEPELAYE